MRNSKRKSVKRFQSQGGGRGCARCSYLGLGGANLWVLLPETGSSPKWSLLALDGHRWHSSTDFAFGELEEPRWEMSPGLEVLWSLSVFLEVFTEIQGEGQNPNCQQLVLPHSQTFAHLLWFLHLLGTTDAYPQTRPYQVLKAPPHPTHTINMSTKDTIYQLIHLVFPFLYSWVKQLMIST